MIDLIIPYYNNPDGLQKTLDSIDQNIFYITIIDDHSSIYMHHNPKANQIFRYNENHGPGYARQWGIEHTSNSYIMFLDTGDIFTSNEAQQGILDIITNNPQLDFISFPYYHFSELTKETDNRLHGKIYKRSFIEKYTITFALSSSYLNEDIGFNRACKLCTKMTFIPLPVIEQIKNEDSLTNKNNREVLYRDQTRALSLVSIHTVDICRKNNIDPSIEIHQIAIALYYWFIRCAAERPEFLQEAWSGVKIFYDAMKDEIKPNMLYFGTDFIKRCAIYKDKINFPINVLRFVNEVQNNEKLPINYLT